MRILSVLGVLGCRFQIFVEAGIVIIVLVTPRQNEIERKAVAKRQLGIVGCKLALVIRAEAL